MKITKISIVIALSLGGISPVMAQGKAQQEGAWMGSALGIGLLSESVTGQSEEMDTNRLSAKFDFGYDFNPHFGVYGSYDYGQHTWSKHDLHMVSIGLKGKEMLTEHLSLFGKAGATYLLDGEHDNGMMGSFGVGLEYQLTNAVAVRVGADYYNDLEISRERKGDLTQVYWGMTYRFGQPETPMIVTETVEIIKEIEIEKEVALTSISGEVFFANDSMELLYNEALKKSLAILKENNKLNIHINGHSDSVGSAKYNQMMSERRAESVANFFKENGIDSRRISTTGYGESHPVASNDSGVGRSQNRRVEFFVE